jgi:[NiFe] hydrogenase diaphorase moiety large subunit
MIPIFHDGGGARGMIEYWLRTGFFLNWAGGGAIESSIADIVSAIGNDRKRLMDILICAQGRLGCLSDETLVAIAGELGLHYVEVLDAASFYAFFARAARGTHAIRFSKTPISMMKGAAAVVAAFEAAAGTTLDITSADGITLSWTSDIGMADQEPACLINGEVFTNLVPADAAQIVASLRSRAAGGATTALPGYGTTRAIVSEKAGCAAIVVERGPVLLAPAVNGAGLRKALSMTPDQVIAEVTASGLRGRGGAGFPTGLKWRMTRASKGDAHYTICNADEGEPGTFKDRVLLSETPDLVIEGMTIAAYALGATSGFMYLRAEYAFLFAGLERVLARRRESGLLGTSICGRADVEIEIRIQLGAGAYICGEESALMESLEGKRGTPRDKPPYPTDHGYLGQPTAVNNVESLACVARILECGAAWFASFGTAESKGTKLMCLSGDCAKPGVYEVPFGISLADLLDRAGGSDAQAVQVSGAAGECIAPKDFGRSLAYEDLSTAGATMVFGPQRDLLGIVLQFADFFADESCGWCVPCRAGTVLLRQKLQRTLEGKSTQADIVQLESVATFVAAFSRCGLGQMAPTPILTTLRNFPQIYQSRLVPASATRIDVGAAISRGEAFA